MHFGAFSTCSPLSKAKYGSTTGCEVSTYSRPTTVQPGTDAGEENNIFVTSAQFKFNEHS